MADNYFPLYGIKKELASERGRWDLIHKFVYYTRYIENLKFYTASVSRNFFWINTMSVSETVARKNIEQ